MLRLKVLVTTVIVRYCDSQRREVPLGLRSDGALPILQYQEKCEAAADQ